MPLSKRIYNLSNLAFLHDTSLKVGLLGGSFNPPHQGHINISLEVKRAFGLDLIIWLVALQNPLKTEYSEQVAERAEMCLTMLRNLSGIIVSSCEKDIGSPYIIDTISTLQRRFSSNKFTWLMGSDSMLCYHKWHNHEQLPKLCDIIVIDRKDGRFLINNNQTYHKFKATLAKKNSNNIMMYKGRLHNYASSNLINR